MILVCILVVFFIECVMFDFVELRLILVIVFLNFWWFLVLLIVFGDVLISLMLNFLSMLWWCRLSV